MEEREVLIQKKEMVCRLILNRPKAKNAFSMNTLLELQKALCDIASDKEIRVVILEGAGGNFCAGADLVSGSKMQGSPEFLEFMQVSANVVKTLRHLPQPIICKVKGVAVGGGANLALSGDFVLASHTARFCEIFVNINIIVDWGGTYFLPRLVGMAKARELAFLGEMVDGKTAHSIGLIYKSVPDEDLDREVDSLAKNLSQRPLATLALIKEGLEKSLDMSLSEVLAWEGAHQAVMVQTREHKEAIRRFFEAKGKQQ
jgi:2-(1,2-epoxy-1,2-dihydrophenyl)acetyl-CoA isomerase